MHRNNPTTLRMSHHANWFWAACLGTVAWRFYELVGSGNKRARKRRWTPPRRYSISELARAVAGRREGRPNREQIQGPGTRGKEEEKRETKKRCWREKQSLTPQVCGDIMNPGSTGLHSSHAP